METTADSWQWWQWYKVASTEGHVLQDEVWIPQRNDAFLASRPDGYYTLVLITRDEQSAPFVLPGWPVPAGPYPTAEAAEAVALHWLALDSEDLAEVGRVPPGQDWDDGGWGE